MANLLNHEIELQQLPPPSDNVPAFLKRVLPVEMPPIFFELDRPDIRYFVYHGGRGGAKSWAVARWILAEGIERPLRVLCARELQNSMKESVYQLLVDQIELLGLQEYYIVKETEILGRNGTKINFSGLRSLKGDANKLKSYEGIDVLWIEEAAKVLKSSFDIIDPTIRKAGAKIIITYNPELDTDFIHKFFVIDTPPPDTIVRVVSWRDNDYFPSSLMRIMEHRKQTDYDGYLHIWEGKTRVTLEGAVYKDELRDVIANNQIRRVPYDPTYPVHTFWDIGYGDGCAIWFAQIVAFEYRIINYYENRRKPPSHYIEMMQRMSYVWGTDYMPHDADYGILAAEGRSLKDLMQAAGRRVQIVKRPTRKKIAIDAVRMIFPLCYFDEKNTADGMQHLRHYTYKVDPNTKQFSSTEPEHDDNSHAADAFGTLGLFLRRDDPEIDIDPTDDMPFDLRDNGLGWMSR